MTEMVLLDDPRIRQVDCENRPEKMVSMRGIHKNILIDETRSRIENDSPFFCYMRKDAALRLVRAAEKLPEGWQFLIKEIYRSPPQQRKCFNDYYEECQKNYPELEKEELCGMTCQFVAPVEVAGHATGGAIDLTLMKDGKEVDMGTEYNDEPSPPEYRTYSSCDTISEEAAGNRRLLTQLLTKEDFVNYPSEWWHWSYGDRYWGFIRNCPSLYAPMEENAIT